jgi:hypothetical protein
MSYFTNAKADAVNQRLYLAVINDAGVEFPEYGKLEIKLGDIRALLPLTIVPVDGTYDGCATLKIRELKYCDPDTGEQAFMLVLCGEPYTKGA